MEDLKFSLKEIIKENQDCSNVFKRNLLKEYLQIFVLKFIYSHPVYSDLFFYGGSCIFHLFGLPRLSEDLDFVDQKKKIKLNDLASDLENYFSKNTNLNLKIKIQKFRIYLKFKILAELNLIEENKKNSDFLFLKIEICQRNFCQKYSKEIIPLFKFNQSLLIKTFDLSTLMATKIRAILFREWQQSDKKGNILIQVKGRDYFDLMWYLNQKIKPNINCLKDIGTLPEIKEKLLNKIEKLDKRSIKLDLEAFIRDQKFLNNLGENIKNILKRDINLNF